MSLSRRRLCRRHLSVAYPHPPSSDRSRKDAYEGGTRRNSRDRARKEDFSAHSVREEEEGSGWGGKGGTLAASVAKDIRYHRRQRHRQSVTIPSPLLSLPNAQVEGPRSIMCRVGGMERRGGLTFSPSYFFFFLSLSNFSGLCWEAKVIFGYMHVSIVSTSEPGTLPYFFFYPYICICIYN